MEKYALLRQRVMQAALIPPENLRVPHAATDEEITRVHDVTYLRRIQSGELTAREIRRIGFPWSPELVERSRRSCGGTIEACRAALEDGLAVTLAGGTHHAFPDHGEGYCVFNDTAIAARAMQAEKRVQRALILDCDVHQGNGTAAIFADDPTVFTFSIHGAKNFPFRKRKSDLDIEVVDDAEDGTYLELLEQGLRRALALVDAELAIYLAGADPYVGDRLGRLALTKEGLAERDRVVFRHCQAAGISVAVAMAGGYARQVEDSVDIHFETVRTAVALQAALGQ
jgi:acetoin utilization deacetylase AcuC-like enzyme